MKVFPSSCVLLPNTCIQKNCFFLMLPPIPCPLITRKQIDSFPVPQYT